MSKEKYNITNVDGDIVESKLPRDLVTTIESALNIDLSDDYVVSPSFVNPTLKSIHFAILKDGKEKYSVNIEDNNG